METALAIVTMVAVATAIYLALKVEKLSERARIAEHRLKIAGSQMKQLIRIANLRIQRKAAETDKAEAG